MLSTLAAIVALGGLVKPDVVRSKLVGPYFQVSAVVNSKPLTFLVDTGAGLTVLTPEGAAKAGISGGTPVQARGANGGAVPAKLVTLSSITVGRSSVKDQQAVVLELPPVLRCDGLVGYSFLKHFVTSFDYVTPSLTFAKPAEFAPHRDDHVAAMTVKANHPHISGWVVGIKGDFMFDTGADGSLTLFSPFVDANQLRTKLNAGRARIVGKGVGGFLMGNTATVPKLSLGGFDLVDVPSVLAASQGSNAAEKDGIGRIGADVIRRFILTLDYEHGKAYFRKSKQYSDPYVKDRSGITLDYDGKRFMVVGVIPGSPAEAAGIKVKDELVSINGVELSRVHPLEARLPLRAPKASNVRIVLVRESEQHEVSFELTDF